MRNTLDGSPVSEGRLSIIEPVVAHVSEVVVVEMSNSLCDFTSGKSSAKSENLFSNFLVDVLRGFLSHKVVVEVISSSEYFNIIQEVGVNGGETDTAIVHLSGKDLVSEEVVTKDTAI